MPAQDAVDDRQADAVAGEVAGGVQSLERLEEPVEVAHAETGTVVAHEEDLFAFQARGPDLDPGVRTPGGEFPNMAGAAYGFADMGPYGGGQAELLRVPWGDFNCLRLGEDAEQRQTDYVMLADIFPTGCHATEMAGVQPGDQTVIYGAGPVGLMAALSATIRGRAR
ncbi:threonine dehydrogenase-like Zn-dependent dehydrogenase [Actinoplanes digitatis]|uniref:Threonine dehydrogenase-like Zn-dependent dehydrogenase n=1 Tax=Actinoplanes digitatis TaxID=1868 RepID=A0A7W7HVC4_9ACTN|nr:threonine dehydrogenase-like Zn-dependent dehydrogenase [Actinoplanes digitatis]